MNGNKTIFCPFFWPGFFLTLKNEKFKGIKSSEVKINQIRSIDKYSGSYAF